MSSQSNVPASPSPHTGALNVISPGAVIGILGAGQLGRMIAHAATRLGYRIHVFSPDDADSPCGQVATLRTQANWQDWQALAYFADQVDVVTLEWENVPLPTLDYLARHVGVHPGAAVLATTQDRLAEKRFVRSLGISVAPFAPVDDEPSLHGAVRLIGLPSILKSARMGYDGKGQARLYPGDDPMAAWRAIGGGAAILEGFVDFAAEISVIVARRADGAMACYPVAENRHVAGILAETRVPASLNPAINADIERRATEIAARLAAALGTVGLLAVEMFVTRDGRIMVNELAPRPHNSGHWTMDFAETSQFEQLVRAMCGLPLGRTSLTHPCRMTNLIGEQAGAWSHILAEPGARLHLYGKSGMTPGRKMGHVNRPINVPINP
jgi:5-(carboxyamino)imidazole ribonucleotide synthase